MKRMSESLAHYDTFIFDEMMVHPLFYTHPKLKKIAVLAPNNPGLLQEILNHTYVTEIWQVGGEEATLADERLHYFAGTPSEWLAQVAPSSLDAIIVADSAVVEPFVKETYQQFMQVLTTDGIFIRPCGSLFHPEQIKLAYQIMQSAGSSDLQILNFPQPGMSAGTRTAIMAVKTGVFKRIREKDIFNKTFATRYYNYDTHKAALAMPEFMRVELISE
jgi:spermidine synthase